MGLTPQADGERRDTVQDAGYLWEFLGGAGLGPHLQEVRGGPSVSAASFDLPVASVYPQGFVHVSFHGGDWWGSIQLDARSSGAVK